MNALLFHLKLESPLLLTGVGNGEENSSRTLPYIPGGALRGMLVSRYLSDKPDGFDPFQDDAARRLFFGSVRYLNAYPAFEEGRALPTPASLMKAKGEEEENITVADFALNTDLEKDTRLNKPFYAVAKDGEHLLLKTDKTLHLHISGGKERGRVRKGESTLFQYEALDSGQTFAAVVLSEDENDLQAIRILLERSSQMTIGRSRSAEYGHVSIASIEPHAGSFQGWSETQPKNLAEMTTVTFLSDALLRDDKGQPTLDLDTVLNRLLKRKEDRKIKRLKAFIRPALVGGFNRKWGLPLPQFPAVGMGSVFVYHASDLSLADLQTLVETGIGERLAEGFGRLAVNWIDQGSIALGKIVSPPPPLSPALSPASQKIARDMADRLLRRWLDEQLQEKAGKMKVTGHIQNHQLARLRSVARRALSSPEKSLQPVLDFMNEKNLKETARKQFESVKVGNERLFHWVRARAEKADALSPAFLSLDENKSPKVAGQKAVLTDLLKREYTLRLIEAVADGKMKESRQGGKE